MAGTSGAAPWRCGLATATILTLPALCCGNEVVKVSNIMSTRTGDQRHRRRSESAIGDVDQLDAGHGFKIGGGKMRGPARARHRSGHLVGFGLGIGHEILE